MSPIHSRVRLSTRGIPKVLHNSSLTTTRIPWACSNHAAILQASSQCPKACRRRTESRCLSAVAASHPEQTTMLEELGAPRARFDSVPFVSEQPRKPGARELSFPNGTIFEAPNARIGLDMAPAYRYALDKHGFAAVQLGFRDPDSRFILSVVKAMECRPDTHSASHGALWDVKFQPEGVRSEATGKQAHSISHSLGEFAWHTDGAFESNPTRFFGFHILHPDRKGGGVFRVLRSEDLKVKLSDETVHTLTHHKYDLRVPDEFFKGERTVKGKVFDVDPLNGNTYIRYRQDIFVAPPSTNHKARKALDELKTLLGNPNDESLGEAVPDFVFKENTILFMDNARFLHSRTKVKDPRRWLRRVRFHAVPRSEQ